MKNLLFVLLFIVPPTVFAQTGISGKVVTENGEPLPNASVFLSNSTIGVYTNAKGEFALANLPSGTIRFVVSYIGYAVTTIQVPADARNKPYLIKMQPLDIKLQEVIIKAFDKEGWKKWGEVFTAAFIGTSSYALNCIIKNKDDLRFIYSEETKELHAFSSKPLIIDNKNLGYQIQVNLVDFTYNLSTRVVDYQTYSFFKEMQGSDAEMQEWKKNRSRVYAFSLLRFMRSLYVKNFANEGYQVRLIERKINTEKQRIKELYKGAFDRITDSLDANKNKHGDINNLVERSFAKDSSKYYKKILSQEDGTEKIHPKLSGFDEIAKQKDSITVLLDCKDYIQVTYTRSKEPEEYFAYRNALIQTNSVTDVANNQNVSRSNPVTELHLHQGIPVEINKSGYFSNVDLFIDGFWGWWEKMATKLPYEYEP